MKVAKLVYVSLMTRVVVEDTATESEILEKAIPRLSEKLMREPFENVEEIVDDGEVPFDEDSQCGNCGFSLLYANVKIDKLGKHAECPECGSTTDVN